MTMVECGEHLVLMPVMRPAYAGLVAVALLAALIGLAWWRRPASSRGRRAVLLTLRLLAALAVVLLLFRPVVRWQGRRPVRAEVAVLLDASRSMALRDATVPTDLAVTRVEAVRYAFLSSAQAYGRLVARAVVNPYAFGTGTRQIGHFGPEPEAPRTDIAEALGFLSTKGPGPFASRLAAVILVSDGRENRSRGAEEAARHLARQGIRVHTVAVGSAEPTDRVRDVAVRDLRAPDRVFVGNRPEVRTVIATLGMKGRAVEAVLTLNGEEADRRRLTPTDNRATHEVVFTPVAATPGLTRLAVAVEPAADELVATNNRAETGLRVEKGGVRVLYLDGRLHPEGKYLARALGGSEEMDLQRRILVGGQADEAAPTPQDLEDFDVLVLGDLPTSGLPPETVAAVAEGVRTGGLSLLALGGLSAFGAGGWGATPLADVLPVTIRAGDGQVRGPLRFQPTAAGRKHFIFRGGRAVAGPMDFASLPPLSGASAVGPLHPTARLLADSDPGGAVLAVREFGRGRAAALTVDTTWQWVLTPGATDGADLHRRFWRQLVLWLAGRDGRPEEDLWVLTDRPRYVLADADNPPIAEVAVGVRGGGTPRVRLTGPVAADGRLEAAGAEWRGTAPLRTPGEYEVTAEVETGGQIRRTHTSLVVDQQDFELAEPLANHENMKRLAAAGDGTFRTVDDLGSLLAELAETLPDRYEPAERLLPLAAGRGFLAVVLGLLSVEWLLRRKWGLP